MEKIYTDASINHLDNMIRIVIVENNGEKRAKQKPFNGKVKIAKLEFLGIFWALKLAEKESIIYSDCLQAVKTINREISGDWLDTEFLETTINLKNQKKCKVEWVKRDKNLAGFGLEKRLRDLSFDPVFKRNVKKFGINHASYKIHKK